MYVDGSGDVSLERVSFSECTAGEMRAWDGWGGGMYVDGSGDVSLERASFSECTAGEVRIPRPHTLASPAHARSHAIAAPKPGEEGRGRGGGKGGHAFPKEPLWACPPPLAH